MGSLTPAEQRPLTKRERVFVEGIALNGLDRAESYSVAFDEAIPEDAKLYEKFLNKATRLFYKPHIRCAYDALMGQVRDAEVKQAVWNKEVATEKLMKLVEQAETEIAGERITMSRLTAITTSIKELNAMHGLNAPTKMEMEGTGMVLNIIEDRLPE